MEGNLFDMFIKKIADENISMKPANILIIGKTGVGKSTLINNVFRGNMAETGLGRPVTQHLTKITKDGIPLSLYDSKGIELDSTIQDEIRCELLGEIKKKAEEGNVGNLIHMIWYCVGAESARIEDFEIQWIKDFSQQLPVILILTKCIGRKTKDFEGLLKNLNLPVVNVVSTLAEEFVIDGPDGEIIIAPFGLDKLVNISFDIFPEAARNAFVNAQKIDFDLKVNKARQAVIAYTTGAFATGFTPIPFSDAVLLVPAQIGMLAHITTLFGIKIEESFFTTIITAIGGVGGVTILGKTLVANALKFFPGIGTLAGGTISGTTAAILTAALGYAYIEVLTTVINRDNSGTPMDNNEIIGLMKTAYAAQMKKGKSLIPGLRELN